MSISQITVGGNSVSLIALPTTPALRSMQFSASDAVAIVSSPFTGQTQAQQWPGGDMWSGTAALPPLKAADADAWVAFLMELRGMANAFQLGDPMKATPRGTPAGTPLTDNSVASTNAAMSQALGTKGWTASANNLLLPGDCIQVGYRLYKVLDAVSSDASGKASIAVWPSLREQPADGAAVITSNAVGLWRLANNKRDWSADFTRLTAISFQFREYR
ncbi:MAG: hypothetical protein WAM66_07575 [Acidobacteriaceae bacterium]